LQTGITGYHDKHGGNYCRLRQKLAARGAPKMGRKTRMTNSID